MRERWKALLDGHADGHHGENERQTDVADDGASHQPRALVVADEVRHDIQRRARRRRDQVELRPEAPEDDRHVEAEHERDRDEVAEVEAVHGHRLERPASQPASRPAVSRFDDCETLGLLGKAKLEKLGLVVGGGVRGAWRSA